MTRAAVIVAFVGVLCLEMTVDARAVPVRITAGSLVFAGSSLNQLGTLSVVGNRGFSANGGVDSGETSIGPLVGCTPCAPGTTISVDAAIIGSAFSGTVTLDGQTYDGVNHNDSPNNLFLLLSGTIDIPAWRNAPVTISTPFEASGNFQRLIPPSFLEQAPIEGRGTAMLTLEPGEVGLWDIDHFRYDFGPVPEPGTLMLVTGGLLAGAIRSRRRRESHTGIPRG